jgi:hypothetical protein
MLFTSPVWAGNGLPFYHTGGVADVQVFFPKDSSYYNSIQLNKRNATLLLYPGYAVVKNEYYFLNQGDSTALYLGFPMSMSVLSDRFGAIHIDSSLAMQVLVNGKSTLINRCESPVEYSRQSHGWMVWETTLPSGKLTRVEIISIVITRSKLSTPSWENEDNTASLLMHNAHRWRGTIQESTVKVLLGDGLRIEDLLGILPDSMQSNGSDKLIVQRKIFHPDEHWNILLRYQNKANQETISQLLLHKNDLMKQVMALDTVTFEYGSWPFVTVQNFGDTRSRSYPYGIYLAMGMSLLALVLITLFVLKRIRAKQKSK